jgi:hypothetical protein
MGYLELKIAGKPETEKQQYRAYAAKKFMDAGLMDMGSAMAYVEKGLTAGAGGMVQQMEEGRNRLMMQGMGQQPTALAPTEAERKAEKGLQYETIKHELKAMKPKPDVSAIIFVGLSGAITNVEVVHSQDMYDKDVRAMAMGMQEYIRATGDVPEEYRKGKTQFRVVRIGGARAFAPMGAFMQSPSGTPPPVPGGGKPAWDEESERGFQKEMGG